MCLAQAVPFGGRPWTAHHGRRHGLRRTVPPCACSAAYASGTPARVQAAVLGSCKLAGFVDWPTASAAPCKILWHNCAKRIITAGLKEAFCVEPYPKSMAKEMFGDFVVIDGYFVTWKRPPVPACRASGNALFDACDGVG